MYIVFAGIAGICLAAYLAISDSKPANAMDCNPRDYLNGVYYFPCAGHKFGQALSKFKEQRTSLRINTITSDSAHYGGATTGYFITVETSPQKYADLSKGVADGADAGGGDSSHETGRLRKK